jgi:hypothetical protein
MQPRRQQPRIFLLFTIAGLVAAPLFGYLPVSEVIGARSWVAVPCEIVWSGIGGSGTYRPPGSSRKMGSSHQVRVAYRYQYEGQEYLGNRYQLRTTNFAGLGAHSITSARAAALAKGLRTTCWVDPKEPQNAVLDRGPTLATFIWVVPLILSAIGAVGMIKSKEI